MYALAEDAGIVTSDTVSISVLDSNGDAILDPDGNPVADSVSISVAYPPEAIDDWQIVEEGEATTISASDLLANDNEPTGDTLTLTAVNMVDSAQGTVELVEDEVVFTPADGFTGAAAFEYTVTDSDGEVDTGQVSLTVVTVIEGTSGDDVLTLSLIHI